MSNWLKLEGDVCAVTGALGGMGDVGLLAADLVLLVVHMTSPPSLVSTPRATR